MSKPKLYIVESTMLPEVFLKVCEAKEYLQTGAAKTVADAVAKAGISRSAFYKYKDAIRPFRDMKRDQVVTLNILTRDRPGALSAVLAIFANNSANILTINQSIPINSTAAVTITAETAEMTMGLEELKDGIESLDGVIKAEILAG